MKIIDKLLNQITMYRLVLYFLIFLLVVAEILSGLKILSFSPGALVFSTAILVAVSWLTNKIFAKLLRVPTNVESVYISALILALIITPVSFFSVGGTMFLVWAAVWAMASKYILNLGNKHVFNPAAFAVALTALTINQSASWWIGSSSMFIFVALGGLLVIRKVRRFDAAISFVVAALVTVFALTIGRGHPFSIAYKTIINSPLLFFAAIMLTEPLTMPPTRDGRIAYGILVGWLFAPQTHLGSFYFTPELALLVGNVFSYIISPKRRYALRLQKKISAGKGIYDFVFRSERPISFRPGQYMEWTLKHKPADRRGNRRYFTLASAPTEKKVILGVRFYERPSSFKRRLLALHPGEEIIAGSLAGDFVLPSDPKEKLVFVAGGVGITPFRSMLKYLIDRKEKRSIVVLYANATEKEIVYQDILYEAWEKLGVQVVCTLTREVPADWKGYQGHFTSQIIRQEIPDFLERTFYISGSQRLVDSVKSTLKDMGMPRRRIKTDFFPGLA